MGDFPTSSPLRNISPLPFATSIELGYKAFGITACPSISTVELLSPYSCPSQMVRKRESDWKRIGEFEVEERVVDEEGDSTSDMGVYNAGGIMAGSYRVQS